MRKVRFERSGDTYWVADIDSNVAVCKFLKCKPYGFIGVGQNRVDELKKAGYTIEIV